MSGFDKIAFSYDFLVRLVYGQRLNNAVSFLCKTINQPSTVLILGGGTGKVLEYLPSNVEVSFIDNSQKMIEAAKSRNTRANVIFSTTDFRAITTDKKFDYIICPFFLDVFEAHELLSILEKIKSLAKPTSQLLVADFDANNSFVFGKLLLWTMVKFFNLLGAIEIKKYNHLFKVLERDKTFEIISQKMQWRGFISSRVYQLILPSS